jgi:cobalt-zinc-cadmium resistance protein CzcA
LIARVLAFAVRQRLLVVVLSVVFVAISVMAALRVSLDAVPDVTDVQVQIITRAPALGPADVEASVTFPIEAAMAGIPRVAEIRSMSRPGVSVVTVAFEEGVDLFFARQQVGERLPGAREQLPRGAGPPELGPISNGLGEVLHFELRADEVAGAPRKTSMELRTLLDWHLSPRLRLVPGVTEVNVFGGESRTMEIELDPAKLAAARLDVPAVLAALERNHLATGGAYLVRDREHVGVRGEGRIATLEELGAVVASAAPGRAPVYLRDLGEPKWAPRVRYGAVTRDARGEAVVGVVMMLRGANSRVVVEDVKRELDELRRELPPGVSIDVYYDRTDLVRRTVHTVGRNLLEAGALVLVVLLLTLASLRAGAVVALAIPLALLGVMLGLYATGTAGNLLSLGAIDFGLVVDGAIIVVEQAQRRLGELRQARGRALTDEERREVVLSASMEVRKATAFGEAIVALVYVPILALQGVEGRMFRPMALAVLFALAAAFVLSLTLVPALASLLLSRDAEDRPSPLLRAATALYAPALRGALRFPRAVWAVSVLAFAGSLALLAGRGREFLPKLDEGTIVIPVIRLPSASLAHSVAQSTQIEATLRRFPEVATVVSRTGRPEIPTDPMGVHMTDVYVMLKPREQWTTARDREGLVAAFDQALGREVPGAGFAYSQPIEMNTNDLLAGISSDVAVQIYGPDPATLERLAGEVTAALRAVPGARDVRAEQIAGLDVLSVQVDRAALARFGVDAQAPLDTVAALGGIEVATVVDGVERFPISVRLAPSAREGAESVAALLVRAPDGAMVPLGQLARVSEAPGPAQVGREHLSRRAIVQANVRGRDVGTFVEEARARIERAVKPPPGYALRWAGEYERLRQAASRLAVVVPLTIALIFVLLLSTFGALRPALRILLNVPIAVSGGVVALALRGMPLSISAGVGFIALFGVAVLNGVVLVSAIERRLGDGASPDEAVLDASLGRLRAVLTTALVASLGFLPMALSHGAGAEVQRPLATVVIGGLLSSTLLTLFVIPATYRRGRARVIRAPVD